MKKILVFLLTLFLCVNLGPVVNAMDSDSNISGSVNMDVNSEEIPEKSTGEKRKAEDSEEIEKLVDRNSKKRRTQESETDISEQKRLNGFPMDVDSEEFSETKADSENSQVLNGFGNGLIELQVQKKTTTETLGQEGINGLPNELLIIIFEVDLVKIFKVFSTVERLKRENNRTLRSSEYTSKQLLELAINHILKFKTIDKRFYSLVNGEQDKYINELINKFGTIFLYGIARFPISFKESLKNNVKNFSAKFTSPRGTENKMVHLSVDQLKESMSRLTTYNKGNVGDPRILPARSADLFGFICRLDDSTKEALRKLFLSSSEFIEIDTISLLPLLEIVFMANGNCLSPLMLAAFSGNEKLVVFLLENKSDVHADCHPNKMYKKYEANNLKQYKNVNALSLAKTKKVMEILINAGAKDLSCLKIFIKHADFETIKYYFEEVISKSEDKEQILMKAFLQSIKTNRKIVFDYFVVNLNEDSKHRILGQAVYYAVKYNQIEFLKILLEMKKQNENSERTTYMDKKGNTALMLACENYNIPIIEMLLQYGNEYLDECLNDGEYCIMKVIDKKAQKCDKITSQQCAAVIRTLIKYGANVSGAVQSEDSDTCRFAIGEISNDPIVFTILYLATMNEWGSTAEEACKLIMEEEKNNKK